MFIKNLYLTYVEGKLSTTVSLLLDILFLFKASKVWIHSDFLFILRIRFCWNILTSYAVIVIIVGNDKQKAHSFIHQQMPVNCMMNNFGSPAVTLYYLLRQLFYTCAAVIIYPEFSFWASHLSERQKL